MKGVFFLCVLWQVRSGASSCLWRSFIHHSLNHLRDGNPITTSLYIRYLSLTVWICTILSFFLWRIVFRVLASCLKCWGIVLSSFCEMHEPRVIWKRCKPGNVVPVRRQLEQEFVLAYYIFTWTCIFSQKGYRVDHWPANLLRVWWLSLNCHIPLKLCWHLFIWHYLILLCLV